MKQKAETCAFCKGTGKVDNIELGDSGILYSGTCPKCLGSGEKIPVDKNATMGERLAKLLQSKGNV